MVSSECRLPSLKSESLKWLDAEHIKRLQHFSFPKGCRYIWDHVPTVQCSVPFAAGVPKGLYGNSFLSTEVSSQPRVLRLIPYCRCGALDLRLVKSRAVRCFVVFWSLSSGRAFLGPLVRERDLRLGWGIDMEKLISVYTISISTFQMHQQIHRKFSYVFHFNFTAMSLFAGVWSDQLRHREQEMPLCGPTQWHIRGKPIPQLKDLTLRWKLQSKQGNRLQFADPAFVLR